MVYLKHIFKSEFNSLNSINIINYIYYVKSHLVWLSYCLILLKFNFNIHENFLLGIFAFPH